MASLIPFDFHCLGHLTGISLRCAPLHVSLPPDWPSHSSPARESRSPRAYDIATTARLPKRLSTLPTVRVDDTENTEGHSESLRTASAATSSGFTTPPPPPAAHAAAAYAAPSASAFTADLAPSPSSRVTSASSSAGAKARQKRFFPRTVSLHSPALCMAIYVELRHAAVETVKSEEESNLGAAAGSTAEDAKAAESTACAASVMSGASAIYVSEVVHGSDHPNWSAIPSDALRPSSQCTVVDIAVFYTAAFLLQACALSGMPADELIDSAAENSLVSHENAEATPAQAGAAAMTTATMSDLCVYRCRVDFRHTCYLGATVEEADAALSRLLRLEEQRSPGKPHVTRPLLYLRCADGIFVPASCFASWQAPVQETLSEWQAARTRTFSPAPTAADFQSGLPSPSSINAIAGRNSLAAVAAAQTAAACRKLPWSRAPSSVGWRYPASAQPRAGQPRMTMGDVKAATYATLAWEHLAEATEQRKASLAGQLDAEAAARPTERALAAQCAALRVQLSAAREALTLSTLEVEELRERIGQRQRRLLKEEETLAAVQLHAQTATSADTLQRQREQVREEEAQRAQLRAQLARARQQRVRELRLVYAVTLSAQYASHAVTAAADAKDHINSAGLPVVFAGRADADAASHLVASSAEAMHEEAVALGHACHVLLVLSILYSCALPYPILLGGGQSHVLASPQLDAAQAYAAPYALTEARKYPLSCRKAAERPLMMAGVNLLLRDGAVLAAAMGKSERRIAASADRLGALLDLLLCDAE